MSMFVKGLRSQEEGSSRLIHNEEGEGMLEISGLGEREVRSQPLTLKEVYAKIKPLICKVLGDNAEGTGFFLNDTGLVLTAAHIKATSILYNGKTYEIKGVSLDYYSRENASQVDLQLLQVQASKTERLVIKDLEPFSLAKEHETLEEGEEIYFGGFPFTQKIATFHQGYVSSISKERDFYSFTIDATVVPGNSGSPVVMQKEGKLHLLGVVRSEISDLHPQFQKMTTLLERMKPRDATMHYIDPLGNQTIPIGIATNLHMGFSAILSNLSTGIGKVVHVVHLRNMFSLRSSKASYETASLDEIFVRRKVREEEKITYKGIKIYPDGHEDKHIVRAKAYQPGSHRQWVDATKQEAASFFPDFVEKYQKNLVEAVKQSIDEEKAIIDFKKGVGAADGKETSFIEVYTTSTGGYHIRPVIVLTQKVVTYDEQILEEEQKIKKALEELEKVPKFENGKRGNFSKSFKEKKKKIADQIELALLDFPNAESLTLLSEKLKQLGS